MMRSPLTRATSVLAILLSSLPAIAQSQSNDAGNAPLSPKAPATAPITELPPVKIIQHKGPHKHIRKKYALVRRPVKRRESATLAPVSRRPAVAQVPTVNVPASQENLVRLTPLQGSEISITKVPGAVSVVNAGDIARAASPAIEDALQQRVPGIILSDTQGNAFATDVQYRGFTASPVQGTPQGLAVYQNGVRISEVFGDTVNWDLIPSNAINSITVITNNPAFGLNAVGGALSIAMKDGFTSQGFESDTRFGSYGRRQESLQYGVQSGNVAAYISLEGINDNGWRDYSPSQIRRMYADLGAKDNTTEVHINFTGAMNSYGAVGPTPVDRLTEDYSSVFTSPQTTDNSLAMLSINGNTKVTADLTLSGLAYYRRFWQKHADGNTSDFVPCTADPALVCDQDGISRVLDKSGTPISTSVLLNPANPSIGTIDRTSIDAEGEGGSLQATYKGDLDGHANQFLLGGSYDHGRVLSGTYSELGSINLDNLVVQGSGVNIGGIENSSDYLPVSLISTTDYYGLFFNDTFNVTKQVALTAGGRYNFAQVDLADQLGTALNGAHSYNRFNPQIGGTYQVLRSVTLYGGYSEANRAPTPAELSCADPARPCLLENFLVSDPSLKQVVSHTSEAGLRGEFKPGVGSDKVNWSLGLYHTLNADDIIAISSAVLGRGYFQNAGTTQRQGVEAAVTYTMARVNLYANYAYVDATYQNALTISSPNNPAADANGLIYVHPGDHIPTIPAHRFKAGFDYLLAPKWKLGADLVAASSQFLFGDESNQNKPLPGYACVNLHTSYRITKNVEVYALVNNLFDHKFATYGAFFENQSPSIAALNYTSPLVETPAQPLSVYTGLKIKF